MAVINAKIWTGNPDNPWAEALAVSGDTIVAVGTTQEIQKLTGKKTNVINAEGRLVTPGFTDSHLHFLEGGLKLASVQLRDAQTPQEFIRRIKEFAQNIEPGEWITGGNWDHENWGGEMPTRWWLDSVTPDNPVWLNRRDGHSALANSAALKAAGITNDIEPLEGGTIVRNEKNELTGILKENAMSLISRAMPPPTENQKDKALQAAMDYVAKQGVTSVHHASADTVGLNVFERANENGLLRTRIYCAVALEQWEFLKNKIEKEGQGDSFLKVGVVKAFLDGSLGSHTAAMRRPFDDKPDDKGVFVVSPDEFYEKVKKADKAGLQVMVHAIGDSANNLLLNVYERVANENGERDRRFRTEHAQHLAPKDIPRFAKLNVIASMQPHHCIDDGQWAEKLIGHQRAKTTYAFRSLLDNGTTLAFGSDWYVAPPSPLFGIYAAVTRRTLDGKHPEGWIPEQKISIEEALKAYTVNAAYTSFDENKKGSLEIGKLADFVILEKDIFSIPPEDIADVKVDMTILGGTIIFEGN